MGDVDASLAMHDTQRRRTERISVTSVEVGVEAARHWCETNPFTIDLRRVTIDA